MATIVAMTLEQFLSTKNIKPAAFAVSIGVAPSTITRVLKGERSPGLDLISKIKAGTKGRVKAEDWLLQKEAAE